MSRRSRSLLAAEPTYLYRAFDASGVLLYVGITCNPDQRLTKHRNRSPWLTDTVRMTWFLHPDRDAALAAERAAIRDESPLHNVTPAEQAARRAENSRQHREQVATRQKRCDFLRSVGMRCDWYGCFHCDRPAVPA